jgi:hypothetical protein
LYLFSSQALFILPQYVFDRLHPMQSSAAEGLIAAFHAAFDFLPTSPTGRMSPNDAAKRDRELRRSSIRNELASPVSAVKGERRSPSHGVWTLGSQRENWRTNLSTGSRTTNRFVFKSLLFVAICSPNMCQHRILPLRVGIEGCWNVKLMWSC